MISNDCPTIEKLFLRVFWANEDLKTSVRFSESHTETLYSHKINKTLHSAIPQWCDSPNVLVVVIESQQQEQLVAGGRLHLASSSEFPLETALNHFDISLDPMISSHPGRHAELAGLWKMNSKDPALLRVPYLVAAALLAMSHRLYIHWTWGIAPQHTLRMWDSLGCSIDRTLFHHPLPYPDERFESYLMKFDSLNCLKQDFFGYRDIKTFCQDTKGTIQLRKHELEFDLSLPHDLARSNDYLSTEKVQP